MSKNDDKAFDTKVTMGDGAELLLSDLWKKQPLVLIFLRHLGWAFCRQQVAQLRQKKQHFNQAGAQVVLVSMGTPEESAAFEMKFNIPFPLISDPKRQLYQAFGLKQISGLELLSPSVAFKGILAMTKGHTIGMPIGDIRQLPGVFIINTDGRIVYSHFASDPSDHPDPDTILEALKTADQDRSAGKAPGN